MPQPTVVTLEVPRKLAESLRTWAGETRLEERANAIEWIRSLNWLTDEQRTDLARGLASNLHGIHAAKARELPHAS